MYVENRSGIREINQNMEWKIMKMHEYVICLKNLKKIRGKI